MNKRFLIFPAVAGAVVAISGVSIFEQPIKTILLIAVLCLTHEFTKEQKHE